MIRQVIPLLISGLMLGTLSCRNRGEESASRMKHIQGQLFRPNLIKLTPNTCRYDKIGSSKGRKDINEYLQKIFDRIVAGNPEVFTGDYAPKNFCISNSPDTYVNAFASPHGRIMFTDLIVTKSPNDAAVASVMAHEAAHILMQHSALRINSGTTDPVDHPVLASNQQWKNFQGSYPDKAPEVVEKIKIAKVNLDAASKKRDAFIAPIRRFLNPVTSSIEKRLRATLSDLDRKSRGLNTEAERLSKELDDYKKSAEYQNMTDDQKKALDEYYGARITVVLDYSPVLVYATAIAFKELDKIDSAITEELSRALTGNLGGVLGESWKKINAEYEASKTVLKQLEGDKNLNAKIFMDKASSLLGYDYNRFNWMEAEADQVGLELMLKAGFSPDGSTELFKMFIHEVRAEAGDDEEKKRKAVESCLSNLADLKSGKSSNLPERGNESHPESCWRLINTGYTELILHQNHYAPYLKKQLATDVLPGELVRIKSAK